MISCLSTTNRSVVSRQRMWSLQHQNIDLQIRQNCGLIYGPRYEKKHCIFLCLSMPPPHGKSTVKGVEEGSAENNERILLNLSIEVKVKLLSRYIEVRNKKLKKEIKTFLTQSELLFITYISCRILGNHTSSPPVVFQCLEFMTYCPRIECRATTVARDESDMCLRQGKRT